MIQIVKETLKVLRERNIPASPKNYAKEFYTQCKINDRSFEDIVELNDFVNNLTEQEKLQVNNNKTTSYYELSQILNNRFKNTDISRFIHHLETFLKPSIDVKIITEIESFIKILSKDPKNFTSDDIIKKLNLITEKRILNDRNIFIEKSNDISKIASLLGKYLDNSLQQSDNSIEELAKIKNEISELDLSNDTQREISIIQSQLVNTIYKLENTIEGNKAKIEVQKDSYLKLEEEIKLLKDQLKEVEKEKDLDYLTGITNRRGFTDEISKIEHKFATLNHTYALVFFDIDFFKKINDEYGHKCGDAVIATFASILKNLTRVNDVVSRYGGEEFVAIINYDKKDEIEKYIKRVKSIIRDNSFVYQDLKFKIKFSAGVAYRESYDDFDSTLSKADELLYVAKSKGRDQIVFDNDIII